MCESDFIWIVNRGIIINGEFEYLPDVTLDHEWIVGCGNLRWSWEIKNKFSAEFDSNVLFEYNNVIDSAFFIPTGVIYEVTASVYLWESYVH